jgi:putative addiction module component (TIGR02574 family)
MKKDGKQLLDEALKLPPEARAAMAASLLESLDREVDENREAAWSIELEGRIRELDSGSVLAIPWAEARKKIMEG